MAELHFAVSVALQQDYQLLVNFDGLDVEPVLVDEPLPLGEGSGPNPNRMLAAAVATCLSASLLFCLRKSRIEVTELHTRAEGELVRDQNGRLRIGRITVTLEPAVSAEDRARMDRCLGLFQDFCTVTESVRHGIEVDVAVEPAVVAAT
ncbi:MAG TPA: OsmC family protein [Longimicrobiales bacterium]|nr:OsmC family protein [Longimicrobiales bacterium]